MFACSPSFRISVHFPVAKFYVQEQTLVKFRTRVRVMFKRFGQIFWGLLLVILDFNIDHVDILPDFIGYILMAVGCGGLVTVSRRFARARVLCWILAVLAVIGYAPM